MKWLKKILLILVVVIAVLFALAFISRNDMKVPLDLWFLQTWSLSVGAWVLLSFTLGMLSTWLLVLPGRLLGSVLIRTQDRKIQQQKQALATMQDQAEPGK